MALRLRTWLLLAAAVATLMAVGALPPEPPGRRAPAEPAPERREANTARDALAVTRGRLLRLGWADAVEARLAAAGPGTWVAEAPDTAAGAVRARLRAAVAAELAALPVRSEITVGVFLVPGAAPTSTAGLAPAPYVAEYLRGAVAGRPYCVAVRSLASFTQAVTSAPTPRVPEDLLGPCAFLAAYGEPGPAVDAWLARAGYGLASRRTGGEGALRDVRRRVAEAAPGSRRFGRRGQLGLSPVEVDACLAGDDRLCRAAVLEPFEPRARQRPGVRAGRGTPVVHTRLTPDAAYRFPWTGNYFLADLEAEHGPERFASFWTSGRPVAAAFQAAFGEPLEAWVRRWAGRALPTVASPPAPSRRELAGGLLWALLGVGVALGVVRRRTG